TDTQMQGCSMDGVHMTGASLLNVRLTNCPLTNAILEKASLVGLNMKDWDLSNSSLVGATLRESTLTGCSFKGANLSMCNMSGCVGLTSAQLREARHEIAGSNLSGIDIAGWDLSGLDLSGSDLSGADIRDCDLRGTTLSGANLLGGRFRYGEIVREAIVPRVLLQGRTLYHPKASTASPDVAMVGSGDVDASAMKSAISVVLGTAKEQFQPESSHEQFLFDCVEGIAGLATVPSNHPHLLTPSAQELFHSVRGSVQPLLTCPLLDILSELVSGDADGYANIGDSCSALLETLALSVKAMARRERSRAKGGHAPVAESPRVQRSMAQVERAVSKAINVVADSYSWDETDPVDIWTLGVAQQILDATLWILRRYSSDSAATLCNLQSLQAIAAIMDDSWDCPTGLLQLLADILNESNVTVPIVTRIQELYANYRGDETNDTEHAFAEAISSAFRRLYDSGEDLTDLLTGTRSYTCGTMDEPLSDITGRALVQQLCSIVTEALPSNGSEVAKHGILPPVVKLCVECISQYFIHSGLPPSIASQVIETVFAVRHQYPTDIYTLGAVVVVCSGQLISDAPRTDSATPIRSSSPERLLLATQPSYIQDLLPLFLGWDKGIANRPAGHNLVSYRVLGINAIVAAFQVPGDVFVETQMGPALEAGLLEALLRMMESPDDLNDGTNMISDSKAVGLAELTLCAVGHAPAGWRERVTQEQRIIDIHFRERLEGVGKRHVLVLLRRELQAEWEDTERGSNPQTVIRYVNEIVSGFLDTMFQEEEQAREHVQQLGLEDEVAFNVAWRRLVAVGVILHREGTEDFYIAF
ncbi:hypothetical protein KIPB_008931, partial [Kipferlia bialata]